MCVGESSCGQVWCGVLQFSLSNGFAGVDVACALLLGHPGGAKLALAQDLGEDEQGGDSLHPALPLSLWNQAGCI